MGSYKPVVGLKFAAVGAVGAPAREAEGSRPSEPGMTLDWSDRLYRYMGQYSVIKVAQW